jgi:hypothetical protein
MLARCRYRLCVISTYRQQTGIGKVHRLEVSPTLLSLRNMEDSSASKPKHECSSRRDSQGNPFTISFSTVLYSSHRLELLFSFLSSICEALNELNSLETTYTHPLFTIANTIDGSLSLFLHHPGRYLFLSSFQDQSANGANDETEDDDATDGEGYEQGSAGMSAWSERSCVSF